LERRFEVTGRTELVAVQIFRKASEKFDNRIRGDAWIDSVSLRAVR
jgi:hypothetical protein